MPKLEEALDLADRKGLAAYDIMTERYEATCALQRIFVSDPAVFGHLESVQAKSIHHIMKVVAGVPLRRPAWFFDTAEYGEALADVGTHVVDLVQWTAYPDQPIDYRKDIRVTAGRHWPAAITRAQFQQVTGEAEFPPALAAHLRNGKFDFYCNNAVDYTLRGTPVKLEILWNWEAPAGGGDVFQAVFRGTKARAELRQGQAEQWRPELYIVPAEGGMAAVRRKVTTLQMRWPGLAMEEKGGAAHIVIPEKYRVGHEAHFAQVASRFFEYMKSPKSIEAWERPNMLAKYYVSTKGVELAQ
jgi:predicted dehydrogenase